MPRFAALYNAFLWSMALCILLFQNLWLEMRVNLGVAFFALWALLFLLMAWTRPLRRVFGSLAGATFSLIAVPVLCWLLLGTERILSVPASIVREGLMQYRLPLDTIDLALGAATILGWLLIALAPRRTR